MRRPCTAVLLAVSVGWIACNDNSPITTAPDDGSMQPLASVTASMAPTSNVLVKLRCGRGVAGWVTVNIATNGVTETQALNCATGTSFLLDLYPRIGEGYRIVSYDITLNGTPKSCGSFGDTDQGAIGKQGKCYQGLEGKGKTYFVVSTRFVK